MSTEVTGKQPPDRARVKRRKRKAPRKAKLASAARRGSKRRGRSSKNFLLELALRALKRLTKTASGPTRNHGFKGVRKPSKTGLAGR